ncbi:MAG: terminase TerL endonuclease subunit [Erysipelotrichaceae bacterium]|nr:terminase TerL endonuclease subunit [Erysipelotrichaceae bacterium]
MHSNRKTYRDIVAYKYAKDIVDRKIKAGKYIIKECERFLSDLERQFDDDFEWYFDLDTYEFIISFQEFFKFADGIKAGQPMKMARFQEWIVGNIFCWKHKEHGYVRFTRAYIQIARKQGKSMLLGYIGFIKSLLYDYAQVYTVASKRDQAEIVIKEIKKMLDKAIPSVKNRFTVYGKAKINKILCEVTQSELAPLSSDANTLDGLGIDLAIVDEFGIHKDYSLYEVCRSSQTYKLDAQIIAITTAYPNTATSPAYTERCILIDAYEGKTEMDNRYFSAIYELDDEDKKNYDDRSNWIKSNPLFAEFPEIMKKLESDYEASKRDDEKYQLFLTKNLNVWLNGDVTLNYLDFDSWRECEIEKVDFTGKEVVVGIDMSKTTDLCGVSILSKDEYGNVLVKSKAFLPKESVAKKEMSDKLNYSSYANFHPEWIHITEGKFVNQIDVENYVRNIEDIYKCKIKAIAFDSWNALHLMSSLSNDYEVIDVKMTYKSFSPVVKKFRELVYDNIIKYEYNPILNFCVGNAITKSDLQENILLDKQKSSNRIDLLVSSIIAYSEIMEEEVEDEYDYYYY